MNEAEAVREVLSSITQVHFEVTNVPDDFQTQSLHARWFIQCLDTKEARAVPHVNKAWQQEDGSVWLESLPLGDTIDWIEVAYGEEAAARSLDTNYSDFGTKDFQAGFGNTFPLVYQRIQTYAEVASRISKEKKVHLELRNNGSKGIVVFTFVSKIGLHDSKTLSTKVEASVEALKEAYTRAMQV